MVAIEDFLLFAVVPYVAFSIAIIVSVYRYYSDRFSVSSLSSQLLERRQLFWGSVPWHYGIIIILAAHLIAALLPGFWGALIGETTRLYIMEITGWALAFFLGAGLVLLVVRRVVNTRVLAVTSVMDWILLTSLLLQVALGVYIAITQRWGAIWYVQTVVPWLWSLVSFNPQMQFVQYLPLIVKFHILNALILTTLIPFTRLIHMFTVPVTYLWRPYQVVVWNRSTVKLIEKTESQIEDEKRRNFLKIAIATSIVLALGEVGALLKAITNPAAAPSGTTTTTTPGVFPRLNVANVSDLTVNKPVFFNYPLENEPNILVKLGEKVAGGVGADGDIVAFSQVCQHLGCLYAYQQPGSSPSCNSSYKADGPVGYCCCHGSIFDYANNGKVLGGPSPRPVPQVKLEVDSSGNIFATGMGPPTIFGHNTGSDDVSYDLQG